jgi:hypothetical protein
MHVLYKVPWIRDGWCSCSTICHVLDLSQTLNFYTLATVSRIFLYPSSHELNFQILRSCLYISKCNNVMKHAFPAFLLSISSLFNQESIFHGINVTCDLSGSSFLNLQALACLLH